jgi:toxin CptA
MGRREVVVMMKSIPGITLQPQPSRQLARFLIVLHLLAFSVLLVASMPVVVRWGLLGVLLIHAFHSYRRLSAGYLGRIVQLRLESDGRAGLTTRDGRKREGTLCADTLVTTWLVILRFRVEGHFRKENLVIAQDALSSEELRRLRVLLRFVRLEPVVKIQDHSGWP